MYARILLYDAFLKFKLDQKLKGAYNVRKSWKHYEAATQYKVEPPPSKGKKKHSDFVLESCLELSLVLSVIVGEK
jgi:hypothetical protein